MDAPDRSDESEGRAIARGRGHKLVGEEMVAVALTNTADFVWSTFKTAATVAAAEARPRMIAMAARDREMWGESQR